VVVQHEAGLVVDEATRDVEDGSDVVVALVSGLVGGAQVELLQAFDREVDCANLHGGRSCPGTDTQIQPAYGQGVGHGGGLQVDVETAVEVGRALAVDQPAAAAVSLSKVWPHPEADRPMICTLRVVQVASVRMVYLTAQVRPSSIPVAYPSMR
jgi:hypothetical protein